MKKPGSRESRASEGGEAGAFEVELGRRLPLARAVLEAFDFAFSPSLLGGLYEANRGRCYTDTLTFPDLVRLVRDCLLEHEGSGYRACVEAGRAGTMPVDDSSFYRKLANIPVAVSRAVLSGCTLRLGELLDPHESVLPACFDGLDVMLMDGKKVKDAAKRLEPCRGFTGSLLGAKALVAMRVRTGLAVAMSDSLDGEANDVPLVADLLPQVYLVKAVEDAREAGGGQPPRAILWVNDRQFADYKTPPLLLGRHAGRGDHFAVRVRKGLAFTPDACVAARRCVDSQGREVLDETGTFGTGQRTMRVRRVTLYCPGGDDVVLVTDLTDADAFPALDLLALYRRRWGIEQMFQEVTETFGLAHLIGCRPEAILFQFSLCLLMYNLIQVLKAYVAEDGTVDRRDVSTANLFYDIRRELQTWSYFDLGPPAQAAQAAEVGGSEEAEEAKAAEVGGSAEAEVAKAAEVGGSAEAEVAKAAGGVGAPAAAAPPKPGEVREAAKRGTAEMRGRLRELLRGSWQAVYTKAADKKPRGQPRPKTAVPGGHTSVHRLLTGQVKPTPVTTTVVKT